MPLRVRALLDFLAERAWVEMHCPPVMAIGMKADCRTCAFSPVTYAPLPCRACLHSW
jgi:hypothetical protein